MLIAGDRRGVRLRPDPAPRPRGPRSVRISVSVAADRERRGVERAQVRGERRVGGVGGQADLLAEREQPAQVEVGEQRDLVGQVLGDRLERGRSRRARRPSARACSTPTGLVATTSRSSIGRVGQVDVGVDQQALRVDPGDPRRLERRRPWPCRAGRGRRSAAPAARPAPAPRPRRRRRRRAGSRRARPSDERPRAPPSSAPPPIGCTVSAASDPSSESRSSRDVIPPSRRRSCSTRSKAPSRPGASAAARASRASMLVSGIAEPEVGERIGADVGRQARLERGQRGEEPRRGLGPLGVEAAPDRELERVAVGGDRGRRRPRSRRRRRTCRTDARGRSRRAASGRPRAER